MYKIHLHLKHFPSVKPLVLLDIQNHQSNLCCLVSRRTPDTDLDHQRQHGGRIRQVGL